MQFEVGERYSAEEIQKRLEVENAGGIRVSLDGKRQVRRVVLLTAAPTAKIERENPYQGSPISSSPTSSSRRSSSKRNSQRTTARPGTRQPASSGYAGCSHVLLLASRPATESNNHEVFSKESDLRAQARTSRASSAASSAKARSADAPGYRNSTAQGPSRARISAKPG